MGSPGTRLEERIHLIDPGAVVSMHIDAIGLLRFKLRTNRLAGPECSDLI